MSDTPAIRLASVPPPDPAPTAEDPRAGPAALVIEAPPSPEAADRKARAAAALTAPVEPLLVPAAVAARLCGIGRATFFRLKAAGKTPAAVKLAGRVLYRVADLRLWVELGCPSRKEFEARRGTGNASGRSGTAGR